MRVPYWLRHRGQPSIFHFVTTTFSELMLDGCLAHFWTGASKTNGSNCFSSKDSPCRCLRVKTVYPGDCEEVRYYSYAMPIAQVYSKPYIYSGEHNSPSNACGLVLCRFVHLRIYQINRKSWCLCVINCFPGSENALKRNLIPYPGRLLYQNFCVIFSAISLVMEWVPSICHVFIWLTDLTEWLGRWHWGLRKMASHAHP